MHPHQGASLHRRGGQAYTRSMRSVATVGRWSIRHPWLAIVAWLAFVALAILSLAATGTQSLENGSVGESARGYALMDQHQAWPPARERSADLEHHVHLKRLLDQAARARGR